MSSTNTMLWSLSYKTYETISILSLGSLVIWGVSGIAVFLGISKSGGPSLHSQDPDTFDLLDSQTWSGLTWLLLISLAFMSSILLLAWSCWGKQLASGGRGNNYSLHL